ncbi:MAG TPA: ATP-binding protein [Thermoanaerobaculia bacterium]|jgi:predicted kinase|nr:ATP-binding protein [Thermoanaerobaculia bacterium]
MEAILFIGLQATGKSSFYKHRFFRTHVRISLDLLRTRNRERLLLEMCLKTGQPFVIDNTNPRREDRSEVLTLARAAGFRTVGYYFQSRLADALRRNASRAGDERIPDPGVLGTYGRLELPARDEGFDELYYVRLIEPENFVVEAWSDEIR